MRTLAGCAMLALVLVTGPLPLMGAAMQLGAPGVRAGVVTPDGVLQEDWGALSLRLEGGTPIEAWDYQVWPGPTARGKSALGAVTLEQSAFHAPIWPSGVDVLAARLANAGTAPASVRLVLDLPAGGSAGEETVAVGGRTVVNLPGGMQPVRKEREWGCTGGVVPMPGWGHPAVPCDPAFANISAGMGGVPIIYRFRVPAHSRKAIALGFCESHHSASGQRPLVIRVEGAPEREIDPIATWGRDRPGVLIFDAFDADGDGRVQVGIYPKPGAPDLNPILNVIWVFPPGRAPDPGALASGALSTTAERYVDVGGANDRLLYEGGPLTYDLTLAPGESRDLAVLAATAGGSVAAPGGWWTTARLWRAAQDVWTGWLGNETPTDVDPALVNLAMCVQQVDGFSFLPEGDPLPAIALLDRAGLYREAERLIRIYWDKPAPEALAAQAQRADGTWNRPAAQVLRALAGHALRSRDWEWAGRAWPAMRSGVPHVGAGGADARESAVALLGVAEVARELGQPEAENISKLAARFDPQARWMAP